ncbi:MAG: hypothetical protein KBF21_06070 [Thermoanaerobaculia bacterium]|jgi:hypothetical protein|nr:hypothetical protein [Thermoanaerobaculia bacterium]MBP9823772.1 hypothetical protein [Thermoanaerobaculia bacterium]
MISRPNPTARPGSFQLRPFEAPPLAALLAAAALLLLPPPASAVKRRAFVTSGTGTGDLASWPGASGAPGATALEHADSICRVHAASGLLPNANTYRAWISTDEADAYCHVQGLDGTRSSGCNGAALPGGGPWYLANGITPWSGTLDQMTGPEALLYRPISLDENLDEISSEFSERLIWTGTNRSGQAFSTLQCDDWSASAGASTGATGDAQGVGERFTRAFSPTCDSSNHLLCLEPGTSETVTPRWAPGALAFASSVRGTGDLGSWPAADGLAGIDAGFRICRNLAAAAHLPAPASFVPWLSTSLVDAVDRLTTDGPFRRPDGLIMALDVAELVGPAFPRNSLHQQEDGRYLDGGHDRVWTGSLADGTGDGYLCDDWTNDVSGHGRSGGANVGRVFEWTDDNNYFCSNQQRLYCFSNVITLFWDGFESATTERWTTAVP